MLYTHFYIPHRTWNLESIPRVPRKLCIPKYTYRPCHGAVESNFPYTQWSMLLASRFGKLTEMSKQKYVCFTRQERKQALEENKEGKYVQLCQRCRQTTGHACLKTLDFLLDRLNTTHWQLTLYMGRSIHSLLRHSYSFQDKRTPWCLHR